MRCPENTCENKVMHIKSTVQLIGNSPRRFRLRRAASCSCVVAVAVAAAIALTSGACNVLTSQGLTGGFGPLRVVDNFDASRFLGTWYEIARYPNSFERNCYGVTAQYALMPDGRLSVLNTCREGSVDGPSRIQSGTAELAAPAKLEVTFFWPISAPYWVIDLGEDYEYAVVGEPQRQFFWILSRTPALDDEVLNGILDRMYEWGYDPNVLIYTPQDTTGDAAN
jgi:apolipoprotein D and lipocalin family protein